MIWINDAPRHGDCARCGCFVVRNGHRVRARARIHGPTQARGYGRRSSSSSVLSGLVTSCCDSLRRFARWYHENLAGCPDRRRAPEILCRCDCAGIRWGKWKICRASRSTWWPLSNHALPVLSPIFLSVTSRVYVAKQFRQSSALAGNGVISVFLTASSHSRKARCQRCKLHNDCLTLPKIQLLVSDKRERNEKPASLLPLRGFADAPLDQERGFTELTSCRIDRRSLTWRGNDRERDRDPVPPAAIARLSTRTVGQAARTSPVVGGPWVTVGHRGWLLATLAMPVPVCLSGPCQSSSRVVSLASSPPPRPVPRLTRSRSAGLDSSPSRRRWPFSLLPWHVERDFFLLVYKMENMRALIKIAIILRKRNRKIGRKLYNNLCDLKKNTNMIIRITNNYDT